MEAPRGVEPTGTNGRTRHTFRPACWVGSRPVVVSFVGWQGALFSCGHDDDTGEAFGCSRPLSGSRTATTGIGRVAGSVAGRSRLGVGRCIGFAVVMAQVRRPVPFRTRKLRPGRGDGTALERVWESSTPPHSTYGPSGRAPSGFPEGPFFVSAHGGSRRASAPGTPFFVFRFVFPAARGRLPIHNIQLNNMKILGRALRSQGSFCISGQIIAIPANCPA